MNIILTKSENNNEILQYFLCSTDKDKTEFSCTQNEIAENAFKNDKTLNIFQGEIKNNTGIIIKKSAFENCVELKAVLYLGNNNTDDKEKKNLSFENGVIDKKNYCRWEIFQFNITPSKTARICIRLFFQNSVQLKLKKKLLKTVKISALLFLLKIKKKAMFLFLTRRFQIAVI